MKLLVTNNLAYIKNMIVIVSILIIMIFTIDEIELVEENVEGYGL